MIAQNYHSPCIVCTVLLSLAINRVWIWAFFKLFFANEHISPVIRRVTPCFLSHWTSNAAISPFLSQKGFWMNCVSLSFRIPKYGHLVNRKSIKLFNLFPVDVMAIIFQKFQVPRFKFQVIQVWRFNHDSFGLVVLMKELVFGYLIAYWFCNSSQYSTARRVWGMTIVPPTRLATENISKTSSVVTPSS